jgi:hypothetical protein
MQESRKRRALVLIGTCVLAGLLATAGPAMAAANFTDSHSPNPATETNTGVAAWAGSLTGPASQAYAFSAGSLPGTCANTVGNGGSADLNGQVTYSITCAAATPPGSYFYVFNQVGNPGNSLTVAETINAPAPPPASAALSVTPSTATLTGTGGASVVLIAQGWNGPGTVTVSAAPATLCGGFTSPITVDGSGNGTLTENLTGCTAGTMTITGTQLTGGVTTTRTTTLTLNPPGSTTPPNTTCSATVTGPATVNAPVLGGPATYSVVPGTGATLTHTGIGALAGTTVTVPVTFSIWIQAKLLGTKYSSTVTPSCGTTVGTPTVASINPILFTGSPI